MNVRRMGLLLALAAVSGCATGDLENAKQSFGDDLVFLQKHTEVVVLKDNSGRGQVVVLPEMQGRVMTSTANGLAGLSFGWINRELIASGKTVEHMNAFGGEDRFWMGPEGGQFSIFFEKGAAFDLDHWYTPASIDTEPWEVVLKSNDSAALRKTTRLKNYSGRVFDVRVDREVRILEPKQAAKMLGIAPASGVRTVAYESNNKMANVGKEPWVKETGLLSIWILGMFNPSPTTTIVVPFVEGPEERLGAIVNDAYFGTVPADRLVVKDGLIFFRADGQYRSKIGLSPRRARDILGSYDATNNVLTLVQYNKPAGARDYVNSMWELQVEPFAGDVVNSYNDGPAEPGAKPMGPFCELETSSPAAALTPGQSILHTHRTFHFTGDETELDAITQATLGLSLAEIKSALP